MKTTISFDDYLRKKGTETTAHFDAVAAREKNVIGSKIASARKERGLNQQAFTDLLNEYGVNIQKAAVSKWENGDSVPSAYQLLAICIALRIDDGFGYFIGDVNLNPIKVDNMPKELNLAGRKLLAQFSEYLISTGKYRPLPPSAPIIEYRDMPVYEIGASAGPGQFLDEGHAEMKSFPVDSIPEDADFAVRVVGTSMEPVFMDGQYAWVQKCDTLDNGDVGVFEWNEESYIKVYQEEMPDLNRECETDEEAEEYDEYLDQFIDHYGVVHPQILLVSYNTAGGANPPKVIKPGDSFHIFGRVLKA